MLDRGRTVSKALAQERWSEGDVVYGAYTSAVTSDVLAKARSTIAASPIHLQRLTESDTELRVVVIGKTVFAADLQWSNSGGRSPDWRRDGLSLKPVRAILPDEVMGKLRLLNSVLGLRYGAYDLILREGRYIFLEVNPGGQWIWMNNDEGGLPILDAFCKMMIVKDDEYIHDGITELSVDAFYDEEGRDIEAFNAQVRTDGFTQGSVAYREYYGA